MMDQQMILIHIIFFFILNIEILEMKNVEVFNIQEIYF
jgi:hypothetical protein